MGIKENKENYYTKELNNIDRYLLRIIKRYFDLEEINSVSSINSIVAEAISRYKSSITYKKSEVDTVNNKFGIVNVNIIDLKGEKKFEKFTAFNKNFGTEQNTICEGNDKRLSDKREPLNHHHKILNVSELKSTLDEFRKELTKYGYHVHANLSILNKLKYTGTNTQIDLTELESLGSIINVLLNTLNNKENDLIELYELNESLINDLVNQVYLFMQRLYDYIENSNNNTNKVLVDYITQKTNNLNSIKDDIVNNYSNIENLSSIMSIINNTLLIISTQETDLINALNASEENTLQNFYSNASSVGIKDSTVSTYLKTDKWTYDESLKTLTCTVNEDKHLMLLSSNKYKNYEHEVTVSFDDSSDSVSTIILAVYKIQDNICTLSLNITQQKISIVFAYQTDSYDEIIYDDSFEITNGIKIKIQRNVSNFKIYKSDNEMPFIDFDISNKYGSIFNEPSEYGYGCYSQSNVQFSNIKFLNYKDIILSDITKIEQNISEIPTDYVASSIEIDSELVYNNTKAKLPYITEDFIINAEISDDNLCTKIQPLKTNITLPLDIFTGKIMHNIYSRRNIT